MQRFRQSKLDKPPEPFFAIISWDEWPSELIHLSYKRCHKTTTKGTPGGRILSDPKSIRSDFDPQYYACSCWGLGLEPDPNESSGEALKSLRQCKSPLLLPIHSSQNTSWLEFPKVLGSGERKVPRQIVWCDRSYCIEIKRLKWNTLARTRILETEIRQKRSRQELIDEEMLNFAILRILPLPRWA